MNTYSAKFDTSKAQEYKALFEKENATFSTPQYMCFQARGEGFTASFYQSGKFVIQGKNTDKIISKYFGENPAPQENILNIPYPHIGIDESGKGDFFGPLVIAGAYLTSENAKELEKLGVCDSKKLTEDSTALYTFLSFSFRCDSKYIFNPSIRILFIFSLYSRFIVLLLSFDYIHYKPKSRKYQISYIKNH